MKNDPVLSNIKEQNQLKDHDLVMIIMDYTICMLIILVKISYVMLKYDIV